MNRRLLAAVVGVFAFLSGAYAEAEFYITPVVSAMCGTAKILLSDLYTNAVLPHLAKVNAGSVIISAAGFSALMLFKRLWGSGRI